LDAITHRENEPNVSYIGRILKSDIATKVKWADPRDNMDEKRMKGLDVETASRLTQKYFNTMKLLTGEIKGDNT
jgi:type IV pilus biogenesis protein CpaD/CtpE